MNHDDDEEDFGVWTEAYSRECIENISLNRPRENKKIFIDFIDQYGNSDAFNTEVKNEWYVNVKREAG